MELKIRSDRTPTALSSPTTSPGRASKSSSSPVSRSIRMPERRTAADESTAGSARQHQPCLAVCRLKCRTTVLPRQSTGLKGLVATTPRRSRRAKRTVTTQHGAIRTASRKVYLCGPDPAAPAQPRCLRSAAGHHRLGLAATRRGQVRLPCAFPSSPLLPPRGAMRRRPSPARRARSPCGRSRAASPRHIPPAAAGARRSA